MLVEEFFFQELVVKGINLLLQILMRETKKQNMLNQRCMISEAKHFFATGLPGTQSDLFSTAFVASDENVEFELRNIQTSVYSIR